MKYWKNLFAGAALSLTVAFSTAAYGIGPYTGDGTGVIFDAATDLEWQEADDGTGRIWKNALAYCDRLSLNNNDDWRLPNISELHSIVDRSRFNPAIDPVFSTQSSSYYWSATTYTYVTDNAWAINFHRGDDDARHKAHTPYVRCVRTGMSFDLSIIWAGDGSGEVGFTPNDSSCTTNCDISYRLSTQATLHATADAGSIFSGWSGGGCSGIADCVVIMDQALAVTATFSIIDNCPADPNKLEPGICGCGVADTDGDNDGTPDCNDNCPADSNKVEPGVCGCGVVDADSDGDGILDCQDGCPSDPFKTEQGICGCGTSDTDGDNDGTPDCNDGCPSDTEKTDSGICGCGTADVDSDSDGTPDCNDNCPLDSNKTEPGDAGCGNPEGIGGGNSGGDSGSNGTGDVLTNVPVQDGIWLLFSMLIALYFFRRRRS